MIRSGEVVAIAHRDADEELPPQMLIVAMQLGHGHERKLLVRLTRSRFPPRKNATEQDLLKCIPHESSCRKQSRPAAPTDDNGAMRPSASSNHSPCSSKTKLFRVQFSDLHVSKKDFVEVWCDHSKANSSKRNTSLMKIGVLCQLMSPLLFTLRRRTPFGYVYSGSLRGIRTELGM
jgi:hypothetical protein